MSLRARETRSGPLMDVFLVEVGRPESILVSGIDDGWADDLRDWFCYTKPIGGDLKVIARPRIERHPGFCVHIAGSDANAAEK
jgi:hypothetical protein